MHIGPTSEAALELLRRVVGPRADKIQPVDLAEGFISLCQLNGWRPPELEEWTRAVGTDANRRRQRKASRQSIGWGDDTAELGNANDAFLPTDSANDAGPGAGLEQLSRPIHRDEPKVGRNDPCPCGSGKKYKKCCG